MHLDVAAVDVKAEIERLESLGARAATRQPPTGVTVMFDPEGNEFCIIPSR